MELFMRNIQFSADDVDLKLAFAPILHKPPFTVDEPIHFHVRTFKTKTSRGLCGILTLPTPELGELFLRCHGGTGISVKGRKVIFARNNKPLERSFLDLNISTGTDPSVTLEVHEISQIDDRISPVGNVMTDGCGTISVALCNEVWSSLRNRKKHKHVKNVPSAYQFRIGGAKGVLVQDPRLEGNVVCLRPSQTKFDAPGIRTLDIQSTSSQPKAMFLNRPLIVLLEYLGTDSNHIIALQNNAISEAQTAHNSFLDASKMFQKNNFGASFRLPSLFHNLATLLDIHPGDSSLGLVSTSWKHDLVAKLLQCVSTYALRELKYRAHIAVPGSYTLLGDERTGLYKSIEGRVLITRSAQIHPGDVQVVTAVRHPELSHLTNVVVFSCKGNRSLASCLGGGGLAGDDFNLLLDESLFPKKVAKPGTYDSLPIKKTINPCSASDIADVKDPGCSECLQLAQYASHAVDFPKTGSPVRMKDLPQLSGLSKPDFLAPEGANIRSDQYYFSPKLLGVLHRRVPLSEWTPTPWNSDDSPSDWKTVWNALHNLIKMKNKQLGLLLIYPSDDLLKEMTFLLNDYSEQLFVIAKVHTISRHNDVHVSEAELISGTIMANWSNHRKRSEAVDSMNLQTQVLAKNVRQALQWNGPESYYDDEEWYEEDDQEEEDEGDDQEEEDEGEGDDQEDEDEDDIITTERNESFRRAYAAWVASEMALARNVKSFGPQSFGLIALGRMLDIIKEA
ncbi:hypothetical protein SERLADRAFT_442939 [Serpula lacrymans var. lacrymans S7.9]|uniref:RNA-dependent RNA polymerase n=1 Tax=Serpula lacrymans var. lacrymans (strain S7.9) TaxID=578457 RepID=F8PB23_SERL9|nr:uncharacterized protein SERLADRAFT_442939 [Serpula lacrymans var. lacrymans S7.9]EGO19463.1 hypothetical protein SERLADRAFT_442939 [Serpula lacrymans var. lacrymans S7.9]